MEILISSRRVPTFAQREREREREKRVPHFRVRGLALHNGHRYTALRRPNCEHFFLPLAIVPIPLAKLRRVLRTSPRRVIHAHIIVYEFPSSRYATIYLTEVARIWDLRPRLYCV